MKIVFIISNHIQKTIKIFAIGLYWILIWKNDNSVIIFTFKYTERVIIVNYLTVDYSISSLYEAKLDGRKSAFKVVLRCVFYQNNDNYKNPLLTLRVMLVKFLFYHKSLLYVYTFNHYFFFNHTILVSDISYAK